MFSGEKRYRLGIQTACNLSLAYVFFLSLSYSHTQFFGPLASYYEARSTHKYDIYPLATACFLLCLCLDRATPPCLTPFPSILNQPATSPTFLQAKFNCCSGACPSISPSPGSGHSSSVFLKYVFIAPYHGDFSLISLPWVDQGFEGRTCTLHILGVSGT